MRSLIALIVLTTIGLVVPSCACKTRKITLTQVRGVSFTSVKANTPISGGGIVDLRNSQEFLEFESNLKCLQLSLQESHLKLVAASFSGSDPELKIRAFVAASSTAPRTLMFEWTFSGKNQVGRAVPLENSTSDQSNPPTAISTDQAAIQFVTKTINSDSRQFYLSLELTSNKALASVQLETQFVIIGLAASSKCE